MAKTNDELKNRAHAINAKLKKAYPNARTELKFNSLFELLIATILSAQCTDKRVNDVTDTLFKRYTKPEDYVKATPEALEQDIKATGFYRQKAKTLRACCETLIKKFNSTVPETVEDMITLPGVGRKTANMVLGNALDIPGITVDRHVIRVIGRLKLSSHTDAEDIERDLQALIPKKDWVQFSHAIILHGRYVCIARKPNCDSCVIRTLCPFP